MVFCGAVENLSGSMLDHTTRTMEKRMLKAKRSIRNWPGAYHDQPAPAAFALAT